MIVIRALRRATGFSLGFVSAIVALCAAVLAIEQALAKQPRLPNLKPAADVELVSGKPWRLKLELEPGWKVNETAPTRLKLLRGRKVVAQLRPMDLKTATATLPALQPGKEYRLQGSVYFCEEKNPKVCVIQSHDQKILAGGAAEGADLIVIRLSR